MLKSLMALRTAVNAAQIAKTSRIGDRAIHTSSTPKDSQIKISYGRIPQSLQNRAQENQQTKSSSSQNRYPLLTSAETIKLESEATWKFLKQEAKADSDAKSIIKMIEDFREKKSQIAIVENQMPKIPLEKSKVDIVPMIRQNTVAYGVDTDDFSELARLVRIIQEHELNLNLVQEFYCRCGFTPFNRLINPSDTPPLTVGYDIYDQQRHTDGFIDQNGNNPLAVNSLIPAHTSNNPVVSTVFIDDDLVIKMLFETHPQAAEILQKPLFITPPSTLPHPILKKDEHDNLKILYSGSIVDQKYTLLKEGDKLTDYFDQATDALKKLDQTIAKAELDPSTFKIVLDDSKILMFHNMLHARTSDIQDKATFLAIEKNPGNQELTPQGRIILSLSAKMSAEKASEIKK